MWTQGIDPRFVQSPCNTPRWMCCEGRVDDANKPTNINHQERPTAPCSACTPTLSRQSVRYTAGISLLGLQQLRTQGTTRWTCTYIPVAGMVQLSCFEHGTLTCMGRWRANEATPTCVEPEPFDHGTGGKQNRIPVGEPGGIDHQLGTMPRTHCTRALLVRCLLVQYNEGQVPSEDLGVSLRLTDKLR